MPRPTRPATLPQPRLARARGWLLAALVTLPLAAAADKVTLSDGTVIEGQVVTETDSFIIVRERISKMEMRLGRNRIGSIEYGSTPEVETQLGDDLMKSGKYEEAIDRYNAAIGLGGDEAKIRGKILAAHRAIDDRDLAVYSGPVNEARAYVEEGRLDRAQTVLEELLKSIPPQEKARDLVKPILANVHYRRAQAYRDSIDYPAAESELRQALELDPESSAVYIELGELSALSSRTRSDAIRFFLRGLALGEYTLSDEERMRVCFRLGELYRAAEEFANAVRYYRMVYDHNPRYRGNLEDTLISCYEKQASELAQSNPEGAAIALKEALEVRPESRDLHMALANNYRVRGDCDGAVASYTKALSLDAGVREANYQIAKCLLKADRILEARKHLEREIEINPRHYDALCELGDIAARGSDYKVASDLYRRAFESDSSLPRAPIALGRAERAQGNMVEARRYINEVLTRAPNDRDANLEMGRILRDEKEYNRADEFFSKVVKQLETDAVRTTPEGKRLMADALLARGEVRLLTTGPSTATRDFNQALEVYPDYPVAYYNIGNAYSKKYASSKQMVDLQSAEENLLKARELDPKNADFALGLGILYHQILAVADTENKDDHMRKAVENYEAYIANGGRDIDTVRGWIRESSGGGS